MINIVRFGGRFYRRKSKEINFHQLVNCNSKSVSATYTSLIKHSARNSHSLNHAPMLKQTIQTNLKMQCDRCAFVMLSDSSSTGFRCGYSYFQVPPVDRKPLKMDRYPEVQQIESCGHWNVKPENSVKT